MHLLGIQAASQTVIQAYGVARTGGSTSGAQTQLTGKDHKVPYPACDQEAAGTLVASAYQEYNKIAH